METHELEFEIAPDGTVRMEVRGVKGPGCDKYSDWLMRLLESEGTVERTAEYYEQSTGTNIDLGVRG